MHANRGCAHAHASGDLIDGQVGLEPKDHGGALVGAQLAEGGDEFTGVGDVFGG